MTSEQTQLNYWKAVILPRILTNDNKQKYEEEDLGHSGPLEHLVAEGGGHPLLPLGHVLVHVTEVDHLNKSLIHLVLSTETQPLYSYFLYPMYNPCGVSTSKAGEHYLWVAYEYLKLIINIAFQTGSKPHEEITQINIIFLLVWNFIFIILSAVIFKFIILY